ncbi:MAG: hypothetical protein ABI828_04545 [Actinomycetota bacterium]
MTGRSARTAIIAAAGLTLLGACASRAVVPGDAGTPTPRATPASTTPASPAAGVQWLIVLRAADDPGGVREDAATLGPVLGDAIQVAPGSCFTGIPSKFGGDRYIVGALGSSKADVDALASDAGIEPLFEGEVQVVCVD